MPTTTEAVGARADTIFHGHQDAIYRRVDKLFVVLMLVQWAFAIGLALVFSPYGWAGKVKATHLHVYAAVLLGGAITSLPLLLAWRRPGSVATRHVIACAQMLWSALLIHLSGGRIETHFHVFGSLAFLAFYRDWKVLVPATLVVALDHLVRQIYWPESVYGVTNPEWWRFLEHAFWVAFEDVVLVLACLRGVAELRTISQRQAQVEQLERDKSVALDEALVDLKRSHEARLRSEKLAAVGQLAASVGHELRNPLTAVRNANTYISRRLNDPKTAGAGAAAADPKVLQFVGLIDRELTACTKIIGDLLDFARERPPDLQPCPLRPLIDEAVALLPAHRARVRNEVPEALPVPSLDKDQFRQILINLLQNAVEAARPDREGEVVVTAEGGGDGRPWRLCVADDGAGIPPEVVDKIFEPLFTTKIKGTGLGLAVVANVVRLHGGTIHVDSRPGEGTRVVIELPLAAGQQAA
ncbi:MAG TPA: ATP-binding protein [Myxococcota bacterium]|jgi:signal transduction histidine kinase|nr:ATP-binding protein [Myxococcota bacterium]